MVGLVKATLVNVALYGLNLGASSIFPATRIWRCRGVSAPPLRFCCDCSPDNDDDEVMMLSSHGGAALVEITTRRPGLRLRSKSPADAELVHELIGASAAHLMRFGDFTEAVSASTDHWREDLASADPELNFVIVERRSIVGCMDLVPVDPPRYGSGFFLSADACGRGLATLSLRALLAHAKFGLGATEVFGGVTNGNLRSAAVLDRAGYRFVADMGGYGRYRVDLSTWQDTADLGETEMPPSHRPSGRA